MAFPVINDSEILNKGAGNGDNIEKHAVYMFLWNKIIYPKVCSWR